VTNPIDGLCPRRGFNPRPLFAPHGESISDLAPIAGGDAAVHAIARRAASDTTTDTDRRLTEAARGVVRALVMSHALSGPAVAAALGLHKRTLRRRLGAEGSGLTELIAEARFDVARQLLRETGLPLKDAADALGYADADAFVRAFRGWAGCTPGQWRSAQGVRLAGPGRAAPA
jgi:AraC-like DNA-binding protein